MSHPSRPSNPTAYLPRRVDEDGDGRTVAAVGCIKVLLHNVVQLVARLAAERHNWSNHVPCQQGGQEDLQGSPRRAVPAMHSNENGLRHAARPQRMPCP